MTVKSRTGDLLGQLNQLDAADDAYATRFVETLLTAGRELGASDLHLLPTAEGLDVRWRIDGVLQRVGQFPSGEAADVVARLKVLAELLTYRNDVPQEGRIRDPVNDIEMRVSTFPTLYGEKAAVRLFAADGRYLHLEDLGLPADVGDQLARLLAETSGAVLIVGPAGSGKTTTVYACLRELVRRLEGGRSIVSLEDPIEVAVPGVSQSQVNERAGFDLATGLRSLMRQDPEVILVGEIRDGATAEIAFQASLTGQLVLSTFHAGSACEAISRLSDMGIEPYLLRSGVLAIICQRLFRRLCRCTASTDDPDARLGLPVERVCIPRGCRECNETGYRGRIVVAELLSGKSSQIRDAILSRRDATELQRSAVSAGMVTCWQRACQAVDAGLTSPAEVRRVLGFSQPETLADNRDIE